jgi:hypothetical protein
MKAGERYNSLVATGNWLMGRSRRKYEFLCDCGKLVYIYGHNVKSGGTITCGCGPRSKPPKNFTHGMARTKVYKTWLNMHSRCYNKNSTGYQYYGGLGIKVTEAWHNFEVFYGDMGDVPKGLSLDRINPTKDYCKENCRWASASTQSSNRRPYNKFGLPTGISFISNRYIAVFNYNRKRYYVGCFCSLHEAKEAIKLERERVIK